MLCTAHMKTYKHTYVYKVMQCSRPQYFLARDFNSVGSTLNPKHMLHSAAAFNEVDSIQEALASVVCR